MKFHSIKHANPTVPQKGLEPSSIKPCITYCCWTHHHIWLIFPCLTWDAHHRNPKAKNKMFFFFFFLYSNPNSSITPSYYQSGQFYEDVIRTVHTSVMAKSCSFICDITTNVAIQQVNKLRYRNICCDIAKHVTLKVNECISVYN